MAKWAFLNRDCVEDEKATLPYRDLSAQRGYGVFDFFRLIGNEPAFLEDHLDRLFFSAREMRLPMPVEREGLKGVIQQLIKKNADPDTGIRIGLTGGCSDDGFTIGKPALIVSQQSFSPPAEDQRQRGIQLLSWPFQRQLPHVKTIDYLTAIWLQPFRIQNGADDILYHNNGFVTECPRSNIFIVTKDDRIVTPSENMLKGITRKKVIELARKDFIVEERPVQLTELKTAREAFITSTTKQILPVAAIDKKVFAERKISSELLQRFRASFDG